MKSMFTGVVIIILVTIGAVVGYQKFFPKNTTIVDLGFFKTSMPNGWTINSTTFEYYGEEAKKTILNKSNYTISFSPGGGGRAPCQTSEIEGFQTKDAEFVIITKDNEKLVRVDFEKSNELNRYLRGDIYNFGLCDQINTKNFESDTPYGHIVYDLPKNWDKRILKEMDSIVENIQSKNL